MIYGTPGYGPGFARRAWESEAPGLWNGLVGAWCPSLGVQGGLLYDQSGFGNHGSLSTLPLATAWQATARGMGLLFDGVDDYVNASTAVYTLTSATFIVWMNIAATQPGFFGIIFARGVDISGMCFAQNSTSLGYHWNNAAATYNWNGGPTIPTGQWVFLALTVAADKAVAYVGSNGLFVSGTNTVAHAVSTLSGIGIGADAVGVRYMAGLLDDARIYNRAMSEVEIRTIYDDPFGMYRLRSRTIAVNPAAGLINLMAGKLALAGKL